LTNLDDFIESDIDEQLDKGLDSWS
jgi:hypothetical protein